MKYKRVLFVGDNIEIYKKIIDIIESDFRGIKFDKLKFCYSFNNKNFNRGGRFQPIDIKKDVNLIIKNFDLIISCHCLQIFPEKLINSVLCVNLHPGFNPFNRGWYPHIFSLVNGKPTGATLHIMDKYIDHGPIIDRKKVQIHSWDTSASLYSRIVKAEIFLFKKNIKNIIEGRFKAVKPKSKGNFNSKNDFNNLKQIDLNLVGSFGSFIDKLRALSHKPHKNAFFIDHDGNKIAINIELDKL